MCRPAQGVRRRQSRQPACHRCGKRSLPESAVADRAHTRGPVRLAVARLGG
jgi:hypothetical protein